MLGSSSLNSGSMGRRSGNRPSNRYSFRNQGFQVIDISSSLGQQPLSIDFKCY